MEQDSVQHSFTQSEVDTVRSITDDGNPIHDPDKWHNVQNNPFDGPIVLGFQLVELAARATSDSALGQSAYTKAARPVHQTTIYNRYRVTFLNAVKADERVEMTASAVRRLDSVGSSRQRFVARTCESIVMKGYRETVTESSGNTDYMFDGIEPINGSGGSNAVQHHSVMTTQKLLSTAHARRFATACGDSNHQNNVHGLRGLASDIYPVSMTSGALVQYASSCGWDLSVRPFVYRSQDIRIDSSRLDGLSTNTAITLQTRLVASAEDDRNDALGTDEFAFVCTGSLPDKTVLFCVRLVVNALGEDVQSSPGYEKRNAFNVMAF